MSYVSNKIIIFWKVNFEVTAKLKLQNSLFLSCKCKPNHWRYKLTHDIKIKSYKM